MSSRKPRHSEPKPPSAARTLTTGASLILSALLTAAALRNPALHWLAWISLLPLFHAIRTLRLPLAAPAGGLWGGSVFLFAVAGDTPVIPVSLAAAALLTGIPAMYTGLAAALTRRIGFNPFVLAVGWIVVELAFTPLDLPLGIMAAAGTQGDLTAASTQTDGILVEWIGRLLGYVFIAFLVAAANASLLALLGHARLTLPLRCLPSAVPQAVAGRFSQTSVLLLTPALCPAHPRAPPVSPAFFEPQVGCISGHTDTGWRFKDWCVRVRTLGLVMRGPPRMIRTCAINVSERLACERR